MVFNPAVSCALESDQSEDSLLLNGQVQTRTCQSGERFSDGTITESVKCTQKPGLEVTGRPHRQMSNCSGTKSRIQQNILIYLEFNVQFGREQEF